MREQLTRLLGPAYLGRKFIVRLVLAVAAFLTFATAEYCITANATLEGGELCSLVAPINRYIETAQFRAGEPVSAGDLLFELVPLGRYRVQLSVDERDIDDVAFGQAGALVLGALPQVPLSIDVTLVTPVTSVVDGRNAFRVEASLPEVRDRLRPGMHGIGKIAVGERRLIWIWTRTFVQWVRLKLWAWWP